MTADLDNLGGEALDEIWAADHRWFEAHPFAEFRWRIGYPVEFEVFSPDHPGAVRARVTRVASRPETRRRVELFCGQTHFGTIESSYSPEAAAAALAATAGQGAEL